MIGRFLIGGLAAKFDCGHIVADGDTLNAVVAPNVWGVVIALFALLFHDISGGHHYHSNAGICAVLDLKRSYLSPAPIGDRIADADCVDIKRGCSVAVVAEGEVHHIILVIQLDKGFYCGFHFIFLLFLIGY